MHKTFLIHWSMKKKIIMGGGNICPYTLNSHRLRSEREYEKQCRSFRTGIK